MAKEKQKMTLNVRKRATSVAQTPPAIDPAKVEAFGSGMASTLSQYDTAALAETPSKPKMIRDGFTMPAEDHDLFAVIQQKCISLGLVTTKSEIVRAGLKYFAGIPDEELKELIKLVPKIKPGRPVSSQKSK